MKDSSGVAPASIPASCRPSRKNVTVIVTRARVSTPLGSKTTHCSAISSAFSIIAISRRTGT